MIDVDTLQIDTEEAIASYLFDEADGFDGHEEDAAEAGRELLRRVVQHLSAEEFAALKEVLA